MKRAVWFNNEYKFVSVFLLCFFMLSLRSTASNFYLRENRAFLTLNNAFTQSGTANIPFAYIHNTLTEKANMVESDKIVWAQLGLAHLLNNETTEAAVMWTQSDLSVEQSLQMAAHARLLGKSRIALQIYDLVIVSASNSRDAWYEKGDLLLERGEIEAALDTFSEGIRGTNGRFGLSDIYLRMGEIYALYLPEPDLQEAQLLYNLAIASGDFRDSSSWARVHFLNGEAYQALKQPERAMAEYEMVLTENPNHYWASTRLGILLWKQRQAFAEAENLLLQAINTHPQEIGAYKGLGQIYLENGRLTEAKRMYEQALKLAPTDSQTQSALQAIENRLKN